MEKAKLNYEKANRLIRIIIDDLGHKQQNERNELREEQSRKKIQGHGSLLKLFEIQLKEISISFLNAYVDSIDKEKYVEVDISTTIIQHLKSFINNQSTAFFSMVNADLMRIGSSKSVIESTHRGIQIIANRTIAYCNDVLNLKIDEINENLKVNNTISPQLNTQNEEIKHSWDDIKNDFNVSKQIFGKKINFIQDKFIRQIIFRDVEQAYILCKKGFYKPSVLLAGGVIEEILRQYLQYKEIVPKRNIFDEYIKACEQNDLLKSAIRQLSDSVRQYRNLVHIVKEKSPKYSISKATAWGAVSIIFTICEEF